MSAADYGYAFIKGGGDVNGHQGLVVRMTDDAGKMVTPREVKMIHHRVDDWHGPATHSLPASMKKKEVARRLAIVRAIHDPETSMEACCVRKRAMLAASHPTDAPQESPAD